MRYTLFFFVSALVSFSFFWFYPAEIFPAKIQTGLVSVETDVSLRTIFMHDNLPSGLETVSNVEVTALAQAWALMAVCMLGLPLMIALRFGRPSGKETELNTEQK